MARIIRFIAGGLAAAFIAMFAEPFFSELLRRLGVDTSLWAGPVMTLLGDFMANEWVRLLGASVIGLAAGLWMDTILRRQERPKPNPDIRYTRADKIRLARSWINLSGRLLEDIQEAEAVEGEIRREEFLTFQERQALSDEERSQKWNEKRKKDDVARLQASQRFDRKYLIELEAVRKELEALGMIDLRDWEFRWINHSVSKELAVKIGGAGRQLLKELEAE